MAFVQYAQKRLCSIIIALNTIFSGVTMRVFIVYYGEDLTGCVHVHTYIFIFIIIQYITVLVYRFRLMIVICSYSARLC